MSDFKSDVEALYAAILADPDANDPRLQYADAIQERNAPGDEQRAEFIRLGVEIASLHEGEMPFPIQTMQLQLTEADLIGNNPKWKECRCPKCQGRGGRSVKTEGGYDSEWVQCVHCIGTGDLLKIHWHQDAELEERRKASGRKLEFRRGFIDAVGCSLHEVGQIELVGVPLRSGLSAFKFEPSLWAQAVVRALPVTRFMVSDRAPAGPWAYPSETDAREGKYWWFSGEVSHERIRHQISPVIFSALSRSSFQVHNETKFYDTAQAATEDLEFTLRQLVRQSVYGTQTKEGEGVQS